MSVDLIVQEDTDPDKLKPYKKDLEYLDDHFQVSIVSLLWCPLFMADFFSFVQYIYYLTKVQQWEERIDQEVGTCFVLSKACVY